MRSAYAKREQEVVNAALAKWIGLVNSVLRGYTSTNQGIPYRREDYLPPINIDDSNYKIKEAAEVYGVEHGLITMRLKQGWTPRQSVGLDPSPNAPALNWVINGEAFQTFEAVARKFGISVRVIRYRAKKGWSAEQVVGLASKPERESSKVRKRPQQTTVDGIVFKCVIDACCHFGVDYKVVKQRLWTGWSIREALGLDKREPYGTKIAVEGVEYKSISAAAKAYGLDHGVIGLRLRKGYSPEQAVGVEPIFVSRTDDRALLWMFENLYGCDAFAMREDFFSRRKRLTGTCSEKRLIKLFVRWGVWPNIDDRLPQVRQGR